MKLNVPKEVKNIAEILEKNGHQTYLVGGCLRDLLLKREPKDWDIATDATPGRAQELFPESVYENQFGTVGVKTESSDPKLKVVEVTTFRIEGRYTDLRHPDEVKFAKTIAEDLSRRDFTVNAIALDLKTKKSNQKHDLVDPYGGAVDLKKRIVRAVGDPKARFEEDALRLMRAVRLATELGFEIEMNTKKAVRHHAGLLEAIARERVRDELEKLIMSSRAAAGVILLEDVGLLKFVLPELRESIGIAQERHHIYPVFDHSVRSLNYAAEKGYSLAVRLAALLHDVGKPRTKQEGNPPTFYNHEMVGAKMAAAMLDRLRFPKELIERVAHLVRYHMFYYNVGEVSEAGVRRFIARVGAEHIDDLLKVREADRIGSGVPKAFPYKLRHLLFMIEKVKKDPVHPKMLMVKGDGVMKFLGIPEGPKVGKILAVLLEEVLDDPKRNTREYLEPRVRELGGLKDEELETLARAARERKKEFEIGVEDEMKQKYRVK